MTYDLHPLIPLEFFVEKLARLKIRQAQTVPGSPFWSELADDIVALEERVRVERAKADMRQRATRLRRRA